MLRERKKQGTRSSSEHGAALTVVLLCIPLFLLLVFFVINTTSYPLSKARVQAASDAAAHAGTLILDPNDEESWDRSVVAAISVLRSHEEELGGFGDAFESVGPYYQDSDGAVEISIERGRFVPPLAGGGAQGTFQSLEDDSLEENDLMYLHSFRTSLANAVNVKVTLHRGAPVTAIFAPTWGDGGFSFGGLSIAAETTVTFGQVKEWVPPFALPLCSLLDGSSTFDPSAICRSDRLFTTLEWQDKFSGATPDFMYDPGASSEIQADQCYWDSPHYPDADNNFGVIGLPSAESTVDAEAILQELSLDGENPGLVEASIGERFAPLVATGSGDPLGSLDVDIGESIWKLITNPNGGTSSPEWPSFSQGLSEVVGGSSARIKPNWIPYPKADQLEPDEEADWTSRCGTPPPVFRPEQQNICGGRRFTWDCSQGNLCETADLPGNSDTIWRVKVPLISELDSNGHIPRCGAPAPLDPSKEYHIIGFVTVMVYDTDIGIARPDPAALAVKMELGAGGAICGGSFSMTPDPLRWAPSCGGPEPMYFETPDSDQQRPCNVVRARIDCNTAFEATKQAADGTFSLRLVK